MAEGNCAAGGRNSTDADARDMAVGVAESTDKAAHDSLRRATERGARMAFKDPSRMS